MNIELRAYHKELKKMLYPPNQFDSMTRCRDSHGNHVGIDREDSITKKKNHIILHATMIWDGRWYEGGYYQDVEWMLFTGEFDSEGKKMYEGDIVNGGCYNGSYAYGYITFKEGRFVVYSIGKFIEGTDDITNKFLKVIGNIYEDKHLLV